MTEVLWHGRGGQGAFTASRLLGAAYSLKDENSFSLAFPSFGPERRGAPIRAFTKLDSKPIGNRSEVSKADFIIYLDDTLFSDAAFNDLSEGGKIIIASKNTFSDSRIIPFDAVRIAEEILHLPITNTAMLGAFAALFDKITLEDIFASVKENMAPRLQEKNIEVIKAAYDEVRK
ncbi:MAG: 2-oxoacid:acceptor oxidoreductase family protein [Treponema sp.]|nr:2-oxoacid:acceptor oxidoreductase family protein [Treponema sp.]